MQGRLITFEGPEGGGKSTQARLLAESLRARGIEVLTTREPGGTPTGEIIRDLLQNNLSGEPLCDATEALLFCASRAQLCRDVLAPALERLCPGRAPHDALYDAFACALLLLKLLSFPGWSSLRAEELALCR